MPGYTTAAKNGMLDGDPLRQRITHLSIHTADSSTGANEQSGGGYARVSVAAGDFEDAVGGELELSEDQPFSGPAAGDATHFGIWDGTTFLGMGVNSGDTAFNAEGVFVLKAGTKMDLNLPWSP